MASRKYFMWTLASIFSAILLILTLASAENTITGTRIITSNTSVPGDTIMVAVDLTITGTVYGLVLDEDIPNGWGINVIDSNGSTYQSGGINWLFADALSETEKRIVYTVEIPSDAAQGDYHITGSVLAVVEHNIIGPYQIAGDSTITVVTDDDSSTMASSEEETISGGITISSTVTNNSGSDEIPIETATLDEASSEQTQKLPEKKLPSEENKEKSPTTPFILSVLIMVAAVFYLKLKHKRGF